MTLTLTVEQEREVSERVASGRYPTGEAVIGEALAALREKEDREAGRAALLADLDQGLASLAAGLGQPLTRESIEQMKADGRRRATERGSGHG
jgi:Arc/MetJ-type ribon-helix-helix transcriptional regulator